MSSNAEEDRRKYKQRLDALAATLLPAVVQARSEETIEELIGFAYDIAKEFMQKAEGVPVYEAQIQEALSVLRDPDRVYENRVSLAISCLSSTRDTYDNWSKYQYNPKK